MTLKIKLYNDDSGYVAKFEGLGIGPGVQVCTLITARNFIANKCSKA